MTINLSGYLIALVLTIAIELAVAIVIGYRKKTELIAITLINIITNPLLNFLLTLNYYFEVVKNVTILIIFLEIVVILVEWLLLRFSLRQDAKRLFILAFAMNLCSYLIGILIF